uniref:Uncharacterized protein n=1 Tax=Glossina palpalis gambiensis TaxID=67801 RepID=A0A1B0BZN9_9MUSC
NHNILSEKLTNIVASEKIDLIYHNSTPISISTAVTIGKQQAWLTVAEKKTLLSRIRHAIRDILMLLFSGNNFKLFFCSHFSDVHTYKSHVINLRFVYVLGTNTSSSKLMSSSLNRFFSC